MGPSPPNIHTHTHTHSPEKGRLCCPGWASWLLLRSVAHQAGTRGLKTKSVSESMKVSSPVGQQAGSLELPQKAPQRLSESQPARLSGLFLLLLLFLAPFTCRYFSPLEIRPQGDCCPIPWTWCLQQGHAEVGFQGLASVWAPPHNCSDGQATTGRRISGFFISEMLVPRLPPYKEAMAQASQHS